MLFFHHYTINLDLEISSWKYLTVFNYFKLNSISYSNTLMAFYSDEETEACYQQNARMTT